MNMLRTAPGTFVTDSTRGLIASGVVRLAMPRDADRRHNLLPAGKRAGILTISGSTLTPDHLAKAGVPEETPIGSTEGGREFTRVILNDELELDTNLARQDNVDAARALKNANPSLGAIVLECTNMVPYASDIQAATGLPVFTIYSFIQWFQQGLAPRRF